jgi:beta-lactamase class D
VILEALLGLGAGSTLSATLDLSAWQAYEAVEEAWIRDRHELLIQNAPAAMQAAALDLEVKLADLRRRAMQFRFLLNRDSSLLRGGVWELTSLSVSPEEQAEMLATIPEYRRQEEQVHQLAETLRRNPQYAILQRAQIRLWKTPQYRDLHRRYMGRMQDLQKSFGNGAAATE